MKEIAEKHTIFYLSDRFPQLRLPIRAGMKDTPEYRDAVLRGKPVFREPEFIGSEEDSIETVETPAGKAEILFLAEREDFEHAYRALAYRCEPADIPASVGAGTVKGLINWEKINRHKDEYLAAGGEDWGEELRRFTSEKTNYLDTVILLSSGEYSNIPAEMVGLSKREWSEKSFVIRKYHELTHFICRNLYQEDVDAVRDEVIADCMGLIAAFGDYDSHLAEMFLGIEGNVFRQRGRLSHYVEDEQLSDSITRVKELIPYCVDKVRKENYGCRKLENAQLWELLYILL